MQDNSPIPSAFDVGVGVKHDGELLREPVRVERNAQYDAAAKRQGRENDPSLFSKAEPVCVSAEEQEHPITKKYEDHVGDGRDAQAEPALHRKADESSKDAPAFFTAQRVEK